MSETEDKLARELQMTFECYEASAAQAGPGWVEVTFTDEQTHFTARGENAKAIRRLLAHCLKPQSRELTEHRERAYANAKEFLEDYTENLRIRDGEHKHQIVLFAEAYASSRLAAQQGLPTWCDPISDGSDVRIAALMDENATLRTELERLKALKGMENGN